MANYNNQGDKWEQIPMAQEAAPSPHDNSQQNIPIATVQVVHVQQQPQYGAPGQLPGLIRGDQGYYDRFPRRIQCQYCKYEVITGVSRDVGLGAHVCCMGMCFLGLWPCAFFPYCMDDFKDTVHFCPNCHQVVGRKNLM